MSASYCEMYFLASLLFKYEYFITDHTSPIKLANKDPSLTIDLETATTFRCCPCPGCLAGLWCSIYRSAYVIESLMDDDDDDDDDDDRCQSAINNAL